jgi:hypothetical protein
MNNSYDLELLRQTVEQEIAEYSYSFSDGAIGETVDSIEDRRTTRSYAAIVSGSISDPSQNGAAL